jgi:DNA-binding NarL/FixJ family response regulator
MAWLANALLHLDRREQAHAWALQALTQAHELGDQLAGAYACFVLFLIDPVGQGSRLDEALASLGDDPESEDLRVLILSRKLDDLYRRGRWAEYDQLLPSALAAAERCGSRRATFLRTHVVLSCYIRGDWDEALRHAATVPPQYLLDSWIGDSPIKVAALIRLRREERDLVAALLDSAKQLVDDLNVATVYELQDLSGMLALEAEQAGHLDQAHAWHKVLIDLPLQLLNDVIFDVPDTVRVALDVGDRGAATAAVAAFQKLAETTGRELDVLVARLCQAQLADDADALLAVAERLKAYGSPPLHALALEEAACRLARQGADVAARTALTKAVKLYADLGATWDIRRADTRLRTLGVRRGSRSAHRHATHGWQSLTPTQRRIAELVAQGMSNPDIAAHLFISRNTVQTHVSSILTKLDMRSRIELILYQTDADTATNNDR